MGHSYGAKVITLAMIEASRRRELHGLSPAAIESWIVLNPAFHPRELQYTIDGRLAREHVQTVEAGDPVKLTPFMKRVTRSTVRAAFSAVPRKALVYSESDHATGRLFNLSQWIFDNAIAEGSQVYVERRAKRRRQTYLEGQRATSWTKKLGKSGQVLWDREVILAVLRGSAFAEGATGVAAAVVFAGKASGGLKIDAECGQNQKLREDAAPGGESERSSLGCDLGLENRLRGAR